MPAKRQPQEKPPIVRLDTPIGPDVDLAKEDVRLRGGRRLTPGLARAIARDTRRATGRPSLSGVSARSPHLTLRVPDDLLAQVKAHAKASGKTVSQTARDALEQLVKTAPVVSPKSHSRRKTKA